MPPPITIVPLGTSSAVPSLTRNHSSLALVLPSSDTLLFDCGEATQNQLQKFKHVKGSKISKIFITHLHGDHLFGLCPLLASLCNGAGGMVGTEDERVIAGKAMARLGVNDEDGAGDQETEKGMKRSATITIYGPKGIREYIRTTLRLTYTHLAGYIAIHELHFPHEVVVEDEGGHPSKGLYLTELPGENLTQDPQTGYWTDICTTDEFTISAGEIKHSVPSIGYVLTEPPLPGKIPKEYPQLLSAHKAWFASHGIKNPFTLLSALQKPVHPDTPPPDLPSAIYSPSGIHLKEGVILSRPSPRPGRKITILGDTHDPGLITALAMNSTVLIHEATNAHLPDIDPESKPDETYTAAEERCRSRGHSTPQMAGRFARRINLGGADTNEAGAAEGLLILNHFSARYKDDEADGPDGLAMKIMNSIKECAEEGWNDGDDDDGDPERVKRKKSSRRVICARDGVKIEVKATL